MSAVSECRVQGDKKGRRRGAGGGAVRAVPEKRALAMRGSS